VGVGPLALIKWASRCDEKGESCIMPLQHSLGHALRPRNIPQNRRPSGNGEGGLPCTTFSKSADK